MGKIIINLSTLLLVFLLVSTGLMENGEAQGCKWECKGLPNFKCWLGTAGHKLCNDFCINEGAAKGECVSHPASNSHACVCRKPGCS